MSIELKDDVFVTPAEPPHTEEAYIEEASAEEETASAAETPKITVKAKPIYRFFKRLFDIVASFLGLVILLIPLIIISIIIVIDSPKAPPIYVQERVGKGGKRFKFYKFRTMVPDADKMLDSLLDKNEMQGPAFKMRNDPRITRVGHFFRKTSIDELPQLWNILKGDMSIVGPRPPLPREVAMYNEKQMQRLLVTPGLTCYWQVQKGRNDLSFDEWLELDLKYIAERNLATDIKIIFKTAGAVFGLEGQ